MHHSIPVAMLIAACSVAQAQEPKSRPVFKSIPDQALGLSCSSVFEVPSPPLFTDDASAPGDKTLPPRLNRETPPVIPHGITDFLPLTRAANMCLDCHEEKDLKAVQAHAGTEGKSCVECHDPHVGQDAKLLKPAAKTK